MVSLSFNSLAMRSSPSEIGIRVVLGADRRTLTSMMLAQGARLACADWAIPVFTSFAIGPLFAGVVFAIDSRDSATLLAGVIVLLLVSLLACYIPARRAASLDAMAALQA